MTNLETELGILDRDAEICRLRYDLAIVRDERDKALCQLVKEQRRCDELYAENVRLRRTAGEASQTDEQGEK